MRRIPISELLSVLPDLGIERTTRPERRNARAIPLRAQPTGERNPGPSLRWVFRRIPGTVPFGAIADPRPARPTKVSSYKDGSDFRRYPCAIRALRFDPGTLQQHDD